MKPETMPTPAEGDIKKESAAERLEARFTALRGMVEDKYPNDAELRAQVCEVEAALKDAGEEAIMKYLKRAHAEVPGLRMDEDLRF